MAKMYVRNTYYNTVCLKHCSIHIQSSIGTHHQLYPVLTIDYTAKTYVPFLRRDFIFNCIFPRKINRKLLPTSSRPGLPEPLRGCSVSNNTIASFDVICQPGEDGGLPQTFVLEVRDMNSQQVSGAVVNSQQVSGAVVNTQQVSGAVVNSQQVSGAVVNSQQVSGAVVNTQQVSGAVVWWLYGRLLLLMLYFCTVGKLSKKVL